MFGFVNIDFAWLAKILSLLFLPFAHEDLAIVLGGYIVVNQIMPLGMVVATIYIGMVVSDFALYGIGAGARHVPWLGRLAVDDRVKNFGDTLKRDVFGLVALCRVVPGVVFVAMVACGWTRVPLGRFTIASLLVSALYLPLMLYLVILFGDALDDHAGLWTWPFLLALVVMAGFMRYRVFALSENEPARAPAGSRRAFRSATGTAADGPAVQFQRAWSVLPRALPRMAKRLGIF
jgi:membrane protein DedA with SNARE-associated domain